jgi:phenylpropionate dioxygenase-like ring-hydroxylating dioxygenase large terminal subunit
MPNPEREPAALLEITRRLADQLAAGPIPFHEAGEVPADSYTSPTRFADEQAALRKLPQVIALAHELAQPGACLARDLAGVSILLVRDGDGALRGFRNACRHRATQLVGDGECSVNKALVCPYHGWTYDLAGQLIHVPNAHLFGDRCASRRELVAVPVVERHGFVWAALEPFDLDSHLAPIDADLGWIGVARSTIYRRTVHDLECNWKHVIDAGLDGYHIRQLHRDTLYRFFLDARAESERAGLHVRSVVGRRPLAERGGRDAIGRFPLRELVTPAYLVFPTMVIAMSPDYLTLQRVCPVAANRTRVDHVMLVSEPPATDERRAFYDKGFALMDGGVLAREDLAIGEAMQRGIAAGADDTLLFGSLERPTLWFCEALDRCIERAR